MNKLIQKINWDLPSIEDQCLFVYAEADFDSNQKMQEPLQKLYQYENQPNMREKIKEYIGELDMEIERLEDDLEKFTYSKMCTVVAIKSRLQTIIEVKNDLLGRLEEKC